MVACRYRTIRIILLIFNFIFWLAGGTLLGIGIWFMVDSNALTLLHVVVAEESLLKGASIIIIVVGGIMFLVGFLGCCGAFLESAGCLFAFAAILVILLLAQIAAGILGGIYYAPVVNEVTERMNETMQSYYFGKQNVTIETKAWDFLQYEMSCCGLSGPDDWRTSWWYHNYTTSTNGTELEPTWPVPYSCCVLSGSDYKSQPLNATLCSGAALNSSWLNRDKYLNVEGCESSFHNWVKSHLAIIIGVAIGVIAVQLFEIIVSCCLAHAVRNRGTVR